jgi:hypothetical protein
LRPDQTTVYNTEKVDPDAKARSERGHNVPSFEEFGRKLDREIERLRELAEKKISPATRLKTAQSLRRMSEKLAKLAADIEAKVEPKADSR